MHPQIVNHRMATVQMATVQTATTQTAAEKESCNQVLDEPKNKRQRFVFIDYIKVFSMLYIVSFWHLVGYTDLAQSHKAPITLGATMIVLGLFVFTSGFLIGKSAARSASAVEFYVKRLLRIYPLYAIAVVLFFLYDINGPNTSLKSLLLIAMFFNQAPQTLWFITTIMVFYFVTPLLSKQALAPKRYLLTSALLIGITVLWSALFRTVDARLLIYFPCYLLGLYLSINETMSRLFTYRVPAVLLALWTLSHVVLSRVVLSAEVGLDTDFWSVVSVLKTALFVLSFVYLIFVICYKNRAAFVQVGIISFLSYGSYAMYLFHRPVYISLKSAYFPASGALQLLYLMFIGGAVLAIGAWIVQQMYSRVHGGIERRVRLMAIGKR